MNDKRRRKADETLHKLVHDLRNALAPIRNALRLMERPEADTKTLAYARDLIDKQLAELEAFGDSLITSSTESARQAVPTGLAVGKRSILIADDNREWVDSLAMVLKGEGHTVYSAYGG